MQGTVHRTWVQAQSLLGPVFEGVSAKHQHLTLLQQVTLKSVCECAFAQKIMQGPAEPTPCVKQDIVWRLHDQVPKGQ